MDVGDKAHRNFFLCCKSNSYREILPYSGIMKRETSAKGMHVMQLQPA